MRNRRSSVLMWALVLCLLAIGRTLVADGKIRVIVIGDSTVCTYPKDRPIRGWGQMIERCFDPSVTVINRASSGRSSKSFITERKWEKTLALCRKGDFVLIQFGHNDSHAKTEPKATDAKTDYKDYLRRYVDDTRARGATPILVTPMHRRKFMEDKTLTAELKPYADAMKEVAAEKNVPCVDLYASSGALFQRLGDAGCLDLFCSPSDRTHFSEKGSTALARLVADGIRQSGIGLSAHVR